MNRSIAFLRAINVGGHTVKMDRLRSLFEQMGLERVETFIASGNVVFEAGDDDPAGLEARIEDGLRSGLGYDVATFLRSPAELAAVADRRSLQPGDPEDRERPIYVGFLKAEPDGAARQRLADLSTATDTFHVLGRELYWLLDTRLSLSTVTGARVEKALGAPTTLRNMNTVERLLAKYGDYS